MQCSLECPACELRFRVVRFFVFNDTATTEIYTLSLHDALPIWRGRGFWKSFRPESYAASFVRRVALDRARLRRLQKPGFAERDQLLRQMLKTRAEIRMAEIGLRARRHERRRNEKQDRESDQRRAFSGADDYAADTIDSLKKKN